MPILPKARTSNTCGALPRGSNIKGDVVSIGKKMYALKEYERCVEAAGGNESEAKKNVMALNIPWAFRSFWSPSKWGGDRIKYKWDIVVATCPRFVGKKTYLTSIDFLNLRHNIKFHIILLDIRLILEQCFACWSACALAL